MTGVTQIWPWVVFQAYLMVTSLFVGKMSQRRGSVAHVLFCNLQVGVSTTAKGYLGNVYQTTPPTEDSQPSNLVAF